MKWRQGEPSGPTGIIYYVYADSPLGRFTVSRVTVCGRDIYEVGFSKKIIARYPTLAEGMLHATDMVGAT